MCTVSMIGDHYQQQIQQQYPWTHQMQQHQLHQQIQQHQGAGMGQGNTFLPSRAEFDQLKSEIENLKVLLHKAKEYDAKTGQLDCEMEEKVEFLKKVAQFVGLNLEEVFVKGKA